MVFRALCVLACLACSHVLAQVAPSAADVSRYIGLFAASAAGDVPQIDRLIRLGSAKTDVNARDDYDRTPLHVAAYAGQREAMRALAAAGADVNAMERDRYDIVTIAAVADDVPTLKLALDVGCSARNITSPYKGTALIAAAHLGHDEVVRVLIAAGAPLDHVNNLGWTAVMEAVVLGDGGPRHVATVKALVDAGANLELKDRQGDTPLVFAQRRGYAPMVRLLENARPGAKT